ncbi:hypothetical protein BH23ACT10_BH23ACT10_15830 [soil metagenome]
MTTQTPEQITRNVAAGARTASRTTFGLLRDSGYATIGATDAAVSYVRQLGTKANELRGGLRALKLPAPTEVSSSLRDLSDDVEQQFESLAGRGRELVASLQGNRATQTATDRVGVARSQVKAAATSVRRAGDAATDAVEEAASEVGTATERDYAAMTVDELRSLARIRDIDGRSDMNKAELITALQQS